MDRLGFLDFPESDAAIAPISVAIPVPVTIPRARPLVTVDEEKAMLIRSPTPVSPLRSRRGSFMTGRDSPVSKASSVSKFMTSNNLRSAGTTSPVFNSTMSPGTTVLLGMWSMIPSLRTAAVGLERLRRESIVCSLLIIILAKYPRELLGDGPCSYALYSWKNPIVTFSTITAVITPPSIQS